MKTLTFFFLMLCCIISHAQHYDCNVRVMVVYTESALTKKPGMLAAIKNAITDTNDAFANSRINHTVSLCRVMKVKDSEAGDDQDESMFGDIEGMQRKLNALIYSSAVTEEKLKSDADIVIGISEKCYDRGLAATIGAKYRQDGYAIMDESRLKANDYVFTHELGHILGAKHDKEHAGGSPLLNIDWLTVGTDYNYAYGKYDDTAPGQYRTIMAYWNNCSGGSTGCPSIKYFSNPDITVSGERIGSANENNARALNTHIPIVMKLDVLDKTKEFTGTTVVRTNEVAHYAAGQSITINQMENYGECTITAPEVTIRGYGHFSNNVHITNLGPCDGFVVARTNDFSDIDYETDVTLDSTECVLNLVDMRVLQNIIQARWDMDLHCETKVSGIVIITTPYGDILERIPFQGHDSRLPLEISHKQRMGKMYVARIVDQEGNSLRKFVLGSSSH